MDANILAALSNRQRFKSISAFVPQGMLTPETQAMIAWFNVYFSTFTEHDDVDVDSLKWLIEQRSGDASPESKAITMQYAELLRRKPDEGTVKGVLSSLYDLDFSGRVGAILAAYDRGEDVDPVHEIDLLAREVKRAKSNGKAGDYIDTSIDDLLKEIANDVGIKFRRISALFQAIAGIQGGASLAIGARPDKGKTSFIADVLTDWAPQCIDFFGPDRPILWLNNEGSGKRIIPRIYQAALGLDLYGITDLSNKGELQDAYTKAIGGVPNYIRVKDIHGASLAHIEQIVEDMQPSVVVFDMLANVRMASAAGGNKADSVEAAWQEVREMAVRYDFIAASTVQVSAEGGNMLYPPYSALKDSKTGIQGATDVILMLGALDNPQLANLRGIGTPKNKFAVPGQPSYIQAQLDFDAPRCRFIQTEGVSTATSPNPPVLTGQIQS